jgi:hypothetical protein
MRSLRRAEYMDFAAWRYSRVEVVGESLGGDLRAGGERELAGDVRDVHGDGAPASIDPFLLRDRLSSFVAQSWPFSCRSASPGEPRALS